MRGRALVAALAGLLASPVAAQSLGERVPFTTGEKLYYRVSASRVGSIGHGEMSVEGPEVVRGVSVFRLRFLVTVRVGPIKGVDESQSWFDPVRVGVMRFSKTEKHFVNRFSEQVELYPEERRWRESGGAAGTMASDAPLDELSFIYFLRTLEYSSDTLMQFDRHYDARRRPTTVRFIKRDTVRVAAGTFAALVIEMRVLDPRRYHGEGVLRIHLTDDVCRVPVRIESAMPLFGTTVLQLDRRPRGDAPRTPCDR
jgi:hypothetical protein